MEIEEDSFIQLNESKNNKMYQMHGGKPSHSILSGYLNDRYKLTFDHFGWEDQY